jgi:UbiD family decarboxylase
MELASVLHALGERPTVFERVRGFHTPVVGGVASTRELVAEGLGTTREKLLGRLVAALRRPKRPRVVGDAPCQDVVERRPDLDKLPILRHLAGDGGRYVTAGVAIIKDPETGRNASFHRLMQLGRDRLAARLIPGRQARTTYDRVGGELEAAFCIGSSTAVLVAASLGPPPGVDELALANALDDTPLVRCVTKDLEVPADTEVVLEGRLTREAADEGPFLDLTETYDAVRKEPVFVVDCITRRSDAMYQCLLPGRLEHKLLMGMPKEPTIFDEVSKVTDCRGVVVTPGGGSWLHAVVQIRARGPDDGRRAIEAAFKGHGSLKHVVVVDEDVDMHDMAAVEWALATRFQAHRDAVVLPGQPGSSLDPSAEQEPGRKARTTKVGLDATARPGSKGHGRVRYPAADLARYL